MKKQLLLLLCLLSFSISQAQTFNDGVLEYTVLSGTNVSVKKFNNVCPTGNLTIPNTVTDNSITYTITEIGYQAFWNCTGLTSLSIPNSVTSIGVKAFGYCTGLTSLSIPNSVTTIGSSSFGNCTGLTSLSIPNSVTAIGDWAFFDCSGLTSLSIPNSVTSIGSYAFYNCSSLTSVTVDWATPLVVSADVFYNVNVSAISLTVPSGTVALYQAAAVWQDFGSFVLSTENFVENNINVELFPNPVKDQLNITISNSLVLKNIRIYNNLGQLIKQSKSSMINVRDLKGVYYAQISTDKGSVTKKIIVE